MNSKEYSEYCKKFHEDRLETANTAYVKLLDNRSKLTEFLTDDEAQLAIEAMQYYCNKTR